MGQKGKEMSPDLKKVAVDLFRNGEKISDIARVLQQPRSTISDIRQLFLFSILPTPYLTNTFGHPLYLIMNDY
jgi:transposase-like protein